MSLDARDTHGGGFPRAFRQYNRVHVPSDREAYGNAISDYNEAIRLDPKDASAYKNRGVPWRAKGEFDKALSDYDKAIRLDPNDAMAYLGRGNARWAKREYRKAVSDYDTAIRFGIRSLGPVRERAMTLRKRVN